MISRRRIAAIVGAGALFAALDVAIGVGVLSSARAEVQPAFSAYGSDGSGTGVHTLGGSNSFQNFRTGAVDNSYPLAASHIDASPAALATASVADTGPVGATVHSQASNVPQPQYATAAYPGTPDASASSGNSIARSHAEQTRADAYGAAGASSPPENANDPGRTTGDEGESHASYDTATSKVVAIAIGTVNQATFAGGAVVVHDVVAKATVASDGTKATAEPYVHVGSVTVNGTPVSVTDKGVSVLGPPAPGTEALFAAQSDAINQALAASGIRMFTVTPEVKVEGARGTVEATGLHVVVTPPSPSAAVSSVTTEYVLGEAHAFAFAVPSVALPPSGGPSSSLPVTVPSVSGVSPSVAQPPSAPSAAPALAPSVNGEEGSAGLAVSLVRHRPTYLLWLYLIWQLIVLATAGALVKWRMDERAAAWASAHG